MDLRRLYRPAFEEYARLAGFPADWNWNDLPAKDRQEEGADEVLRFGAGRLNLTLANAVPPPLARAIGRALVDHHRQRSAAQPAEHKALSRATWQPKPTMLRRYRKWLSTGKRLTEDNVRRHLSDLRAAKKLVAGRGLPGAVEERVSLTIRCSRIRIDI